MSDAARVGALTPLHGSRADLVLAERHQRWASRSVKGFEDAATA